MTLGYPSQSTDASVWATHVWAANASKLEEKTFRTRTVLVFGAITDAAASETVRRLLALDAESGAPINMIVSSPGGHLESGDAIHDVVRFISAPVNMIGAGTGPATYRT